MNRKGKKVTPILKEIVNVVGGFSCTTFCLKTREEIIYGRNFDFMIGHGHVLINKRNVTKKSLVEPSEKQLQWTSKYGSLTFNQLGREFPYGGMNEAGLVIEQLWLDQTRYPEPDDRYALSVLQWIQYQLDNAQRVEDVVSSDSRIRISDTSGAALHFFVADQQGEIASIEFIDGVMEYNKSKTMPYPVLTNNLYRESIAYVQNPDTETNGNDSNDFTGSSLQRFHRAAEMLAQLPHQSAENNVSYGFKILAHVSQKNYTQWRIVYNISNREVHFKTYNNRFVKTIKFDDYDFSSHSPSLYMNLDGKANTEVAFIEHTSKANMELINKVFDSLEMLKDVPDEIRKMTANYPETTIFNR